VMIRKGLENVERLRGDIQVGVYEEDSGSFKQLASAVKRKQLPALFPSVRR
jgi:hypothetical protein